MKKMIAFIMALVMMLSMTACGGASMDDGTRKIAIVQQLDHSSLDEIRLAIEAEFATYSDKDFTLEVFNGQNETSVMNQIGTEILSEEYDLIIAIATTAAQIMVTAADGQIPVVYAAVSDPVGSGLGDIVGTSDALNTPFILDMMLTVDPDVKTVGLLYSNSEPNSQKPIAEAKEYLDAKGIAYIEKTGTTAPEIIEAASALVGRVDAVFTPTDNAVMSAEVRVAEILTEAGIPHYAGADSFVQAGAFATCGVNYTELGTFTAKLAIDYLAGMEVKTLNVMDGGIITVNADTASALGLDYSCFASMANTVLEVRN